MTNRTHEVVLVVDDNPETLDFLIAAIEGDGATVLVARNGEAALGVVDKIVPDIVLMDAVMPGMDGFATCRALKRLGALTHTPVIFMTGLSEPEHVVHALNSGGVDYLTKPIHLGELRARIQVHLANSRRAQGAAVALDASGRHLVAVSGAGALRWATPQALKLAEDTPELTDRMLEKVKDWLALYGKTAPPVGTSVALGDSADARFMLAYLGEVVPDEHLFRLIAAVGGRQSDLLAAHFGLTPREGEILTWVVQGKSNRDIGEILGLSPRTVNKHLEQVFAKMGVENRALAAVRATHVLNAALLD